MERLTTLVLQGFNNQKWYKLAYCLFNMRHPHPVGSTVREALKTLPPRHCEKRCRKSIACHHHRHARNQITKVLTTPDPLFRNMLPFYVNKLIGATNERHIFTGRLIANWIKRPYIPPQLYAHIPCGLISFLVFRTFPLCRIEDYPLQPL